MSEREKWLRAAEELRADPRYPINLSEEARIAYEIPNPFVEGWYVDAVEPTARICESIAYSAEFWDAP